MPVRLRASRIHASFCAGSLFAGSLFAGSLFFFAAGFPAPAATPVPVLHPGERSPAVLRLQQALAELGYLPVSFTPSAPEPETAAAQLRTIAAPLPGQFRWRYANVPASLRRLWSPGEYSVMVQGAVMTFEASHGLAVDGLAGPLVWGALADDLAHQRQVRRPYAYVYVSLHLPQTLSLWEAGRWLDKSPANTGIPAAPTPQGTWPIYLRYRAQTMTGYTPDGTSYRDEGVPWVSYFYRGCAIHGFVRKEYGYPQSLGCVELPVAQAQAVWQHTTYGTLVTVGP
ncbi:hypothetical protein GCM10010885_10960 [Alicyclobacillus cellulosilyticus]|uniref:L,D-TPase catalytic domain-containing protein n=1 Tax=Alicyclobacillus cellulosilyticus TaxID=1003997 RepID=A0A917K919_9BACL|nr:L,D-transpeptidase family protein [Alicyclobacillus cellulosilyticus]GGJ03498.1 hypothetical protein GCM10010885_10960 [Alicyclobacillus cellulosilyticus]